MVRECGRNSDFEDSHWINADIPALDLYGRHIPSHPSITRSPVEEASRLPPDSPTDSGRRPSLSGRSSGGGSSRSTSFNLPDEARSGIRDVRAERGDEVEEEEMDEEGEFNLINQSSLSSQPPVAQAKHDAFVRARGRHYSNEAEAMKVSSYHITLTGFASFPRRWPVK